VFSATSSLAEVVKPIKISRSDAEAFATSDVKTEVVDGVVTKTRVVTGSADHRFEAGLYSTEAKSTNIESYPVDEFMLVVGGGATMSSADGAVLKVKKGDALFMPKGWKGNWATNGFKEFYVAYTVPDSANDGTPAQVVHPMKIVSTDPRALTTPDVQTFQIFKYRVMGKSADKSFRAGLSAMHTKRSLDSSNETDEEIFLISGGETFLSPDGTVVAAKAGDVVFMPKGWKGKYRTNGYEEFYAIYGAECMANNTC
jgi:uncharacterized cupin superfamily protein